MRRGGGGNEELKTTDMAFSVPSLRLRQVKTSLRDTSEEQIVVSRQKINPNTSDWL